MTIFVVYIWLDWCYQGEYCGRQPMVWRLSVRGMLHYFIFYAHALIHCGP